MSPEIREQVRHNFTVNVLDGALFGLGLGFASFVTVIPLFISQLTDSTLIIGLIASLHVVGWQLPQLLTSNYVARLRRYKPMVMFMTVQERWPFFGLAIVAALIGTGGLSKELALLLSLLLIIWHSLGGGLTATAWQSMIGKIMPPRRIGTFFGTQSAAANLLASGGAVLAGFLLFNVAFPYNFALCFAATGLAMTLSLIFLAATREPEHNPTPGGEAQPVGWKPMATILKRDRNFRWYLAARILSQVPWMAISFYTIYGVRRFGMNEETAGFLAGLLMLCQALANPVLGWLGDRIGHRVMYAVGALMMTASAALALFAPEINWLYLAFALAGCSNAATWAVSISFTLEFGSITEKPLYIGLANTLIAPATLAAPLFGGWLADTLGFEATFAASVLTGLITFALLQFIVRDPRPQLRTAGSSATLASAPLEG